MAISAAASPASPDTLRSWPPAAVETPKSLDSSGRIGAIVRNAAWTANRQVNRSAAVPGLGKRRNPITPRLHVRPVAAEEIPGKGRIASDARAKLPRVADRSAAREAAAAAAAELRSPDGIIGLGSGRAVWATIAHLPAGTRAVVASERTREVALDAGLEVLELDGTFGLELALDGADEVDPDLGLIKGGGGALLREKIVIAAAERFVVVAESAKKVDRLGEGFRLPVEVVRFAWKDTRRRLSAAAAGRRAAPERGRLGSLPHRRGPLHPRRPHPGGV